MYSRIVEQSEFEIVRLQEAKNQLNIIDTDDNQEEAHIQMLIDIACDLAQKYTNRMLSPGKVELVVSGKKSLFLPYGEATESENAITATVTGDPVGFEFEPISQVLTFDDGAVSTGDTVKITYDAGYKVGQVPRSVKMGILMIIAALHEYREEEIPIGTFRLLDTVKIRAI